MLSKEILENPAYIKLHKNKFGNTARKGRARHDKVSKPLNFLTKLAADMPGFMTNVLTEITYEYHGAPMGCCYCGYTCKCRHEIGKVFLNWSKNPVEYPQCLILQR